MGGGGLGHAPGQAVFQCGAFNGDLHLVVRDNPPSPSRHFGGQVRHFLSSESTFCVSLCGDESAEVTLDMDLVAKWFSMELTFHCSVARSACELPLGATPVRARTCRCLLRDNCDKASMIAERKKK